jgi:hypothetical protein
MLSDFEQMRIRAKELVETLWPRMTPQPPSEEAVQRVTDIATAVAWYEVQRYKSRQGIGGPVNKPPKP